MQSSIAALSSLILLTPLFGFDGAVSKQSMLEWNSLGIIHQAQFKLAAAEHDYRQALAINRSLSNRDMQADASIINNIATILQARGDFKAAQSLLDEGYGILKANQLISSHAAGPLLANLALNLQQQGRFTEARHMFEETEVSFQNAGTTGTTDFAMFLSNFGLLNLETGHINESIAQQRRAFDLQAKLESVNHKQHAYVLNNLGLALEEAGQLTEAKSDFLQAIQFDKAGPPALARHLVQTLSNLAVLEQKIGQNAEANAHESEAEKIAAETLRPDDLLWGVIWDNFGALASSQKDYRQARQLYEKSAALWEKTLGPGSSQYATTLSNLATLDTLCGHYKQAQEETTRALAIDSAYFGPEHLRVAGDLANLATELFYRNKVDESLTLLLRAKAIQEKAQGQDGIAFARILDDLGGAHVKLARLEEAKHYYEQAIGVYELHRPSASPQYAACLHRYAGVLRQLKDFANAEQVDVRATGMDVRTAISLSALSN